MTAYLARPARFAVLFFVGDIVTSGRRAPSYFAEGLSTPPLDRGCRGGVHPELPSPKTSHAGLTVVAPTPAADCPVVGHGAGVKPAGVEQSVARKPLVTPRFALDPMAPPVHRLANRLAPNAPAVGRNMTLLLGVLERPGFLGATSRHDALLHVWRHVHRYDVTHGDGAIPIMDSRDVGESM
jgi:hypothetical protein